MGCTMDSKEVKCSCDYHASTLKGHSTIFVMSTDYLHGIDEVFEDILDDSVRTYGFRFSHST